MTHKERIIKYMEMKRDVSLPIYFNDEDKDEIKNWPPNLSQEIWEDITKKFPLDPLFPKLLFIGEHCPFCIHSVTLTDEVRCEDCGYGKRHGICDEPGSDYGKVRSTTKGDTQPIIDFVEANR